MESFNRVTYYADLVFCIDATQSMGKVIELVKRNALSFQRDLADAMRLKGKALQQLRIRIIAFRDYIADKENAMMATDFFLLPHPPALSHSSMHNHSAPSRAGAQIRLPSPSPH